MGSRLQIGRRGEGLAPCNPATFDNPLDLIAEEHMRARQICAQIEQIAREAHPVSHKVEQVLSFLASEFTDHVRDETEELFPLLLERCEPEDDIQHVVDRMKDDYTWSAKLVGHVAEILKTCLARASELGSRERAALMRFVTHARKHLIVENAIVLPLARARLTAEDLAGFRLHILRRRGFVPNE